MKKLVIVGFANKIMRTNYIDLCEALSLATNDVIPQVHEAISICWFCVSVVSHFVGCTLRSSYFSVSCK